VNPISRKTALTVGSLVAAGTLAVGTGVAGAATPTKASPAEKTHHRIERVVKRQTRNAHRIDRLAARLEKADGRLSSKVDALPDGATKTDALAKLADVHKQAEAAKANDAKVLAALQTIDATNIAASKATLKADRALIKASATDLRAGRQDVRAVLVALKK